MRYLCISATFLDPYYHGKEDNDRSEWPPSPMRLYQAMLAGSHAGGRTVEWQERKAAAYRWLEQQGAPWIKAPSALPGTARTVFVPRNDGDRVPEREKRLTSKLFAPHLLPEDARVHFLWPVANGEWERVRDHVAVICNEARHLLALGWGIDQVVGEGRVLNEDEMEALSGKVWQASTNRGTHRVPREGTLEDLQGVHRSFVGSVSGKTYQPPLKPSVFRRVAYRVPGDLPPRAYAVFELPEEIAFRPEDTVRVAAMLRSMACDRAQTDTHPVFPGGSERFVAGHVNDAQGAPRFSYLPLPSIGHRHADGMIRRVMIAEPFGFDGTHAQWAEERLTGRDLVDHDGVIRGMLMRPWRKSTGNMIDRYAGKGRVWCSVTPVILPGHDEHRQVKHREHAPPTKAEQLLFKSLAHAGIPLEAVAHVVLRKAPFWSGALHPRQYFRPNYLADQHARPGWHVRIEFHQPFNGPLSIGAGRHAGLGVFAIWGE